jgi:RES domain-containing protein
MTFPVDDELLAAVDAIGTTTWSGAVWRHTGPKRNPLSGEGARLFGGRWNPPDLASTLYLATDENGCRLEFARMAEGQGRGTASFLPRRITKFQAEDLELVDLRQPEHLAAVGLDLEDLTADDWAPCQRVGAAAHFLRAAGIIAPSAVGIGDTLAVFEARIASAALQITATYVLDP